MVYPFHHSVTIIIQRSSTNDLHGKKLIGATRRSMSLTPVQTPAWFSDFRPWHRVVRTLVEDATPCPGCTPDRVRDLTQSPGSDGGSGGIRTLDVLLAGQAL